jgi:nucleotide-binding universal stress UspA family protein
MNRKVPKIVVGVDGSEGAAEALRWAVGEARLRGASLRVVHAWSVPLVLSIPSADTFGVPEPAGSMEEVRMALHKEAGIVLQAALEGIDADDIEVEGDVVKGKVVRVLVEAANDADILVVGSRGLGGFTGLLLGSVSQQCAHHAPCPLVIVPPSSAR